MRSNKIILVDFTKKQNLFLIGNDMHLLFEIVLIINKMLPIWALSQCRGISKIILVDFTLRFYDKIFTVASAEETKPKAKRPVIFHLFFKQ